MSGNRLLRAIHSGADVESVLEVIDEDPHFVTDARDDDGNTALHLAVMLVDQPHTLHLVNALLAYGADITSKNFAGWSVLHSAVSVDNVDILPVLLQAGASVDVVTETGETPLDLAINYDQSECTAFLLNSAAYAPAAPAITRPSAAYGGGRAPVANTAAYAYDPFKEDEPVPPRSAAQPRDSYWDADRAFAQKRAALSATSTPTASRTNSFGTQSASSKRTQAPYNFGHYASSPSSPSTDRFYQQTDKNGVDVINTAQIEFTTVVLSHDRVKRERPSASLLSPAVPQEGLKETQFREDDPTAVTFFERLDAPATSPQQKTVKTPQIVAMVPYTDSTVSPSSAPKSTPRPSSSASRPGTSGSSPAPKPSNSGDRGSNPGSTPKSTPASADVKGNRASTSPNCNHQLLEASYHGNSENMKLALENGANIEIANGTDGCTALHYAAQQGHLECVKFLIIRGAPLDKRNKDGQTPIHMAAQSDRNHLCVTALTTAGADANTKDAVGETPIYIAAKHGYVFVVDALLKAAVSLDDSFESTFEDLMGCVHSSRLLDGASVLIAACISNSTNVIKEIVDQRPDLEIQRKSDGHTALHIAVSNGNFEVVDYLLKAGADGSARNLLGFTALFAAIRVDNDRIVRLFAQHLRNVNKTEHNSVINNESPLYYACEQGSEKCVRALVDLRVDVNAITTNGRTPLHAACAKGNAAIVNLLIRAGAVANVLSIDNGWTALHEAIANGHKDCVKILLDYGGDLELPTEEDSCTPLILAAKGGHANCVELLLDEGADIDAVDSRGLTAFDWAQDRCAHNHGQNYILCFNKLQDAKTVQGEETKSLSLLQVAVLSGRIPRIKELLKQGEDPAAQDVNRNSALHLAFYSLQKLPVIKLLMEHPSSMWSQLNKDGQSPVEIALQVPPQPAPPTAAAAPAAAGAAPAAVQRPDPPFFFNNKFGLDPHSPQDHGLLQRLYGIPVTPPPVPPQAQQQPPPIIVPVVQVPADVRAYVEEQLRFCLRNPKDCEPSRQWAAKRALRRNSCPTMDKIMELTGIRRVKLEALNLFDTTELDKGREEEARQGKQALHFIFVGNPGTGKTTVARLFGQLLCDLGIRGKNNFVETSGQKLLTDGADTFAKTTLPGVIPGVLFIDEVYQLDPKGNAEGRKITNALMEATENEREKLTVIIAGYKEDVRDKFFSFNDGLPSRFPREVTFDDFDDVDFRRLVLSTVGSKRWRLDQGPTPGPDGKRPKATGADTASIAARRLVRGAGTKGFGNARTCRVMIDQAIKRANDRLQLQYEHGVQLSAAQKVTLLRSDILGEPIDLTNSPLLKELNDLIGVREVKEAVLSMVRMVQENFKREEMGEAVIDVSLHRLFLGNPGTGKTTLAKIYGKILGALGLLSKGEVEVVGASRFTGDVVGSASKNTNAIFDSIKGKVLVIDEAYVLGTTIYGKEALDTIVERVQGNREDFAVIMCGYDEQMRTMLRDCNPGLARRFRLDGAFNFADFNNDELESIVLYKSAKESMYIDKDLAHKAVVNVLAKERDKPNFGNAGAVDNLLNTAKEKMMRRAERTQRDHKWVIEPQDLFSEDRSEAAAESVDGLRGPDVEKIREKIDDLKREVRIARKRGRPHNELISHWLFLGPPGTGKTSVARLFGTIYCSLGLLSNANVVEIKARDLLGQFVGSTTPIVNKKMDEALGGVLFIDEAYGLCPGHGNPYGVEAMEAILANITSPKYKGKLVIIMAGYEDHMRALIGTNPGLPRRFTEEIEFSPWGAQDCVDLFVAKLAKQENAQLADNALRPLLKGFEEMSRLDGWGNAGDVENVLDKAIKQRNKRSDDDGNVEGPMLLKDVATALDTLLQQRRNNTRNKARASMSITGNIGGAGFAAQINSGPAAPRQKQQEAKIEQVAEEEDDNDPPANDDSDEQQQQQLQQQVARVRIDGDDDDDDDDNIEDLLQYLVQVLPVVAGADMYKQRDLLQAGLKSGNIDDRLVKGVAVAVNKKADRIRPLMMRPCRTLLPALLEKIRLKEEDERRLREAAAEADRQRIQNEIRQRELVQEKIRQLGRCPVGFEWIKQPGGYRCAGGSHLLSDAEIDQYTI